MIIKIIKYFFFLVMFGTCSTITERGQVEEDLLEKMISSYLELTGEPEISSYILVTDTEDWTDSTSYFKVSRISKDYLPDHKFYQSEYLGETILYERINFRVNSYAGLQGGVPSNLNWVEFSNKSNADDSNIYVSVHYPELEITYLNADTCLLSAKLNEEDLLEKICSDLKCCY